MLGLTGYVIADGDLRKSPLIAQDLMPEISTGLHNKITYRKHMEIYIDQDKISEAINQTASKAVEDALKGYSIHRAISEVVTTEVAEGAIAEAIRHAVKKMDTAKLTQHLASELQRHTIKAVVNIMQEGMLQTVCKLRGIGDYSDADKKERARLKIELFQD